MGEMVLLGLRLLVHDKRRLFAMSASIAVGVVIMFVQLGLLEGILDAQAIVARLVRGDLMVMNQARVDLQHWDTMDPYEVAQIAAAPGVAKVTPVYEDHVGLTDPDGNNIRRIIVFAFPPDADSLPLDLGDPKKVSAALEGADGFLYDVRSRPIYGQIRPGMNINIDRNPLPVLGLVRMGPDIINDGNIFMSEGEWLSRRPWAHPIMAVVRLAPGASIDKVRKAIVEQTPGDVAVYTPAQAREREIASTLKSSPIGLIFGVGVIAGMVIGAINGYQVLYTEVSDHLTQLATLKAIGFADRFLHGAIMAQALALSGTGFIVGVLVALGLDAYVATATRLPIHIDPRTAAFVCAANLVTCALAGGLALRRVGAADPASLY
jgi:putative ABC transport system permease protein